MWRFTCNNFVNFDTGAVDFEALGREEYEFRKALFFRNFKNSKRARAVFDEAKAEYDKKVENGMKGGRPKKNQDTTADGDTREDSLNVPDGSDAVTLESATSADTGTLDSLTDKDEQPGAERATGKPSRTTQPQNSYGEFGNVKMTTAEFEKLVQAEGADRANALIEELSSYLASSGKRYKSHYATLLNWGRRKDKDGEPKQKFLTSDDISRRNIEESKRQLDALMANRRAAHG
jgi:hypothetical protein